MSFRQFGGLQYAARHNAVSSNYNTSNNLLVTQNVGQSGSYIKFESDISGNITIYGDLDVDGNITATGTITHSSDYRIKEDVKDLSLEEFTIDNLRPVYFKFKESKKENIGLIAHELQEQIPFLVEGEKDGEKTQTVNYMALVGLLIKEIQELKKEVKVLKQLKGV